MLEKVWTELSYNQKKEIGKYALVFTGGVLAGLLINKFYDDSMAEINKRSVDYGSTEKIQLDITNPEDDIIIDEDAVEDTIEK